MGVRNLEKALIKYKEDRAEWISSGVDSCEITLQIKDSVPNLLNGFEQIYKGDICYPSDFFRGYSQLKNIIPTGSRYSANIDLMIFLLKMEAIETRDMNIVKYDASTSAIYYELDFPFYYSYQPPIIDERVKNQSSIFIFHPFSKNVNPHNGNIEQVWQKIVPDFVIEIQNPKEIKKELDYLGINEKHIFCDYDHVAQYTISKF